MNKRDRICYQAAASPRFHDRSQGRRDPDLQLPTSKVQPIPTQWPKAKVEPIPTRWPDFKLLPIATQAGAPIMLQAPARGEPK
jgi:hypothetical protein